MTIISITNSGNGSYTINGESNPTISLTRGNTYNLAINANGHPFWIQTVSGGYSSNNIYSLGVTNNGIQTGTITFVVPMNAPNTLYYACQLHSSMKGMIIITDPVSPTITNYDVRVSSMSSLFTNNAQVYYKPNSLSTGGGGSGVKNYRHKQLRT